MKNLTINKNIWNIFKKFISYEIIVCNDKDTPLINKKIKSRKFILKTWMLIVADDLSVKLTVTELLQIKPLVSE